MATANKIMVKIDNQVIELTGAEKEAFLADVDACAKERLALEMQAKAQAEQRKILLDRLGITAEEAALLLG